PDHLRPRIGPRDIGAAVFCRRFVERHLSGLVIDLHKLASLVETYPNIAVPIRSHAARNVDARGLELVDLSGCRIEAPKLVRFTFCKPNPSIARNIGAVRARVLGRNFIRRELSSRDIQPDNTRAGGAPHILSIRIGPHEVAADRALEVCGYEERCEPLRLGIKLEPAPRAADVSHPDRAIRAERRRAHMSKRARL